MGAEPSLQSEANPAELEPRRANGLDLSYVPRLVVGALQDLRTIADATRVLPAIAEATRALPQVARSLTAIEARTETLDREVTEMHKAVEAIREEMDDFRADVHGTMHPVSRAAARVRRMRGGDSSE